MEWDVKERHEHSVHEIVDMAVESTLLKLGFDMEDPVSIQKDINHLRRSREICELIQNRAIGAVIGIILLAVCGVAWTGFNVVIDQKHQEMGKK